MSETQKHTTRNGFITIIGTYIIWGLLPPVFCADGAGRPD